jgi:TMEM175 potassium channel family protein
MTKTRLEAFSDGVLAIIITIMVLELKIPHGTGWEDIKPLLPVLLSYILSFVYIAIYWGNHHHLLHTVVHVNSKIIWSNMHLLFWLTLIPFATAWMGENNFEKITVAVYGAELLVCGLAYYILQQCISKHHKFSAPMEEAMKKQTKKGIISQAGYLISIPVAFLHAGISAFLFVAIAVMWIIPDKNIENALKE